MGDLVLNGNLNFMGNLTLQGTNGGKVKVDALEVVIELSAPKDPPHTGNAPLVIQPPPPASPLDPGLTVWVINSFNKTVKALQTTPPPGAPKPIVAQGLVMQGNIPTWPGMVLPGSAMVKINGVPITLQKDQVVIFPSGASVLLSTSGQ